MTPPFILEALKSVEGIDAKIPEIVRALEKAFEDELDVILPFEDEGIVPVLVEVRGGVAEVKAHPLAWVTLIDYDNTVDLSESEANAVREANEEAKIEAKAAIQAQDAWLTRLIARAAQLIKNPL